MAQADNKKAADKLNPVPAGSINLGDLAELLKVQARELAAELKKPDEETQAKLASDKARKLAAKAANISAWQAEQAGIKQRQDGCGHVKENGKHNFVGQVHGNGLCKAICQTCHWCSDWFEPFAEMVNGGAELRDFGGLTRTIIDQRVAAHKSKTQVAV